jgi:hypothetical protein
VTTLFLRARSLFNYSDPAVYETVPSAALMDFQLFNKVFLQFSRLFPDKLSFQFLGGFNGQRRGKVEWNADERSSCS